MDRIQIISFSVQFVMILGNIITYAIIARIIVSWIALGGKQPSGRFAMMLFDVTEPFINLARKIPHKWGMIDFAPLIALIGVDLLTSLVIVGLTGLA